MQDELKTVMVNNFHQNQQKDQSLVTPNIEHKKDYDIWCLKFISWLGTGIKLVLL
jgi:hypothetical protein